MTALRDVKISRGRGEMSALPQAGHGDTRWYCSKHVIFIPVDGTIIAVNCASNKRFRVATEVVELLTASSGGASEEELRQKFPHLRSQMLGLLQDLEQSGLLHKGEEVPQSPKEWALWSSFELMVQHQAHEGGLRCSRPEWGPSPERKDYPDKRRTQLGNIPLPSKEFGSLLKERRSIRDYTANVPLTLTELTAFLGASAQVSGRIGRAGAQTTLRPSPSAGARHGLELYLMCRNVIGLEQAVYHYDPFMHDLVRVGEWNADTDDLMDRLICRSAMLQAPPDVAVFITAVMDRVLWKYERLGLLAVYRDAGCLLQTMYLVATCLDLAPCAVAATTGPKMPSFVGAHPMQEIHVASMALGIPAHRDTQVDRCLSDSEASV